MFLDHIITKDHAYLHEYNVIKESLIHKGGPQPRWYQFLKEHIATINNCNRLSIDLRVPLIQNPSAARPAIPPISIDTLHHPKRSQKWVVAWVPSISDILEMTHRVLNGTLSFLVKDVVNILAKMYFTTKTSRPLVDRSTYHPHYRILAYNDFLYLQKKIPPCLDRPIAPPQLSRPTFSNNTFINQLLEDDMIVKELQDIARTLNPFNVLVFYTDGSYNVEFLSNEYPMGYGWTTSNIENANITYSGSVKYFPSSTKAEIMAIHTALITCPPKCNVTIHTDSQAAIDAFHKSKNLHSISPRRFNKINNNILWSTIHQIINTLSLNVKFIKVKVHSGDLFNDIADALAKVGRVVVSPTIIKHNNLPNQSLTIEWNEEIPLDKDVHKCIGTILNYRRIENHFNRPSLNSVKESTKDNLIDWSLSSKWFNFNGRNDSTNNINCLFCLNTPESNHHLWICPETRSLIRNCFITLGNTLIDLLTKNADQLSLVVPDSVKFSPTFRWAYRNEEIHPVALLFLKSYITNDLKERNSKWKNLRSELGLSKKSFKNYYKDFNQSRTPGDIRPDNQFMRRGRDSIYINPFNDYPVLSSNIWNLATSSLALDS
ncbi:hypothetical protein RhiirB3_449119 [Rhizophagus irregularis]|nr:hypothetical protein RhiirB3_449119 [Rhizophagus irregularis]